MRIVLARPRGFCAGVEMAIRCLEIVRRRVSGTIYVYHEIVHNRQVVDTFRDQGFVFVDAIDEVPIGATLVFSAHGVAPATRQAAKARSLRTVDATCPLVAKVHAEAIRFRSLGYQIVLVGHDGHDEVVGTMGEAPDAIHLVQSEAEVDQLPFTDQDRIAYLTQTTLSVDETSRILARLRRRFPGIEGPSKDDICYATQNRQQAVSELAGQADLVIVVGSQNSSNSRRLCEVASQHGVPAHLVDSGAQLEEPWFVDADVVGITAGASAPEDAVQDTIGWIQARFECTVSTVGFDEPSRRFPLPVELDQLKN